MDPDAQPKRFQFSMATGLIVVSGFCVVFSLTAWHPLFGGMASSLIVGTWWTYAAVRAGHRRLAYYLAAWPMGVVAFVVGCWPALLEIHFSDYFAGQSSLMFLGFQVVMCLAFLLSIFFLRHRIRRPGSVVVPGIQCVYATAALFVVLAGFFAMAVEVASGRQGLVSILRTAPVIVFFATAFSPVWATIVGPVAFPIGVAFCKILRRIDPEKIGQDDTDRAILRIVDIWQAVKEGPLGIVPIAERLGTDWQTAATDLKALCDLGILEYKKETGYCRKADPSSDAADPAACKAATDTLQ